MTQPATSDPRTVNLPLPAVQMAYRIWQVVKRNGPVVQVSVLVAEGVWYIYVDGKYERLGKEERA